MKTKLILCSIVFFGSLLALPFIIHQENKSRDKYGNKINAVYNVYYEYAVYNSDTIAIDTIYKQINF